MVAFKHALVAAACIACTAAVEITVSATGGNATGYGQTRYGFLHEDINNSGDGGIYAELVRNRAFQYSKRYPVSLDGYRSVGGAKLSIQMLDEPLSDALPASMRVKARDGASVVGFQNEGYWGMDVKQQTYTGSFWVKGAYHGQFTASLRSNSSNTVFGSTKVKSKSNRNEWVEHTYELVPTKDAPSSNNSLSITFDASVCAINSLRSTYNSD
jgi:alpha-N-arabinofuranosidase